jgi:hypothetical protein
MIGAVSFVGSGFLLSGKGLGPVTMCEGSSRRVDRVSAWFQLESLILAQNERWRQA